MIIAISSSGKELDSLVDPRFGRCPYFAFYDTENKAWDFVANPGSAEGSGAGVKAAQSLIEQKAGIILTGDVGPNASRILNSAGIKVYSLPEVTLKDALKYYEEGRCRHVTAATVSSHAGLESQGTAGKKESPPASSKIAIATDHGEVSQHFGRCPAYTLVEIKNGNVTKKAEIPNPGHRPGFLPRFMAENGVDCVIAGGMGPRAQNLFEELNIGTITGVSGTVAQVIDSYLSGRLVGGESLCDHGHHESGHSCD